MVKKEVSEIGAYLRRLRFEHNEGQEDMAKKLDVTAPYISLLEYKQPVTRKLAVKIMQAYNLSEKEKAIFIDMVTRDIVKRFWRK